MSNMAECKMCSCEFDYVQNISGNARQLCRDCREVVDRKEIEDLEESLVFDGNRYRVYDENRENEYDIYDILIEGKFPEFKSDADRYVCASEMAKFINKNGFLGTEWTLVHFLEHLGRLHRLLFMKNLEISQAEYLAKHPAFKRFLNEVVEVVL